ncbi:MAG: peptidase S8, partial [Chloroflexi bacterium]
MSTSGLLCATIRKMNANAAGGSKIIRNVLCLNVGMLLLLSLGIPSAVSQAQAEETLLPEASQTIQPTETAWLAESGTATPGLPTSTELPASITPSFLPGSPAPLAPQLSDEGLRGEFVPGEVVVRFRNRASKKSIEQCIQSVHASVTSEIDELNTLVLSVPEGRVAESLYHLQSCSDIRYAEPNYTMHIADVYPSDPGWGNQYGLVRIRAPQGWELATGSSSVTIAIVDTGIDRTHPDLAGKLVAGIDIANGDTNPQDDHGHGTHVAGIAAALSNNGRGVAGVSWGARLMPVKVLNAAGSGSQANVAAGIVWATDHGAQIINLSLGSRDESLDASGFPVLKDAVDYATSAGVIVVAAAGNGGGNSVMYPAAYPNVIAVGATDSSNTRAGLSNYGPEIDLCAPGISIFSTVPGGYSSSSGTSMAAPFVSGLASILLGIPGNGSPAAVTGQMQNTALDL